MFTWQGTRPGVAAARDTTWIRNAAARGAAAGDATIKGRRSRPQEKIKGGRERSKVAIGARFLPPLFYRRYFLNVICERVGTELYTRVARAGAVCGTHFDLRYTHKNSQVSALDGYPTALDTGAVYTVSCMKNETRESREARGNSSVYSRMY